MERSRRGSERGAVQVQVRCTPHFYWPRQTVSLAQASMEGRNAEFSTQRESCRAKSDICASSSNRTASFPKVEIDTHLNRPLPIFCLPYNSNFSNHQAAHTYFSLSLEGQHPIHNTNLPILLDSSTKATLPLG